MTFTGWTKEMVSMRFGSGADLMMNSGKLQGAISEQPKRFTAGYCGWLMPFRRAKTRLNLLKVDHVKARVYGSLNPNHTESPLCVYAVDTCSWVAFGKRKPIQEIAQRLRRPVN